MSKRDDFEDIVEINGDSETRKVPLDGLLSHCAAWPELLVEGLSILRDQGNEPSVLCFCQLPFFVNTIREPYQVNHKSAKDLNLRMKISFRHFTIRVDKSDLRAIMEPVFDPLAFENSGEGAPIFTQLMALIPLWGPRRTYYAPYLDLVEAGHNIRTTLVPAKYSWTELGGAIDAQSFEFDLARRMARELNPAIRRFLRHYMAISLSETPIPDQLFGYFLMTAAGRIATLGPTNGIISYLISQGMKTRTNSVTPSEIENASRWIVHREFSKFERQIFAMKRLCDEGELALSLIGTMSLIEWLLKSSVGSERSTLARVLHSDSLKLPSDMVVALDVARKVRNELVHGEPPDRRELSRASERSEAIEFFGQRTGLHRDLVNSTIKQAFDLYRLLNMRGNF